MTDEEIRKAAWDSFNSSAHDVTIGRVVDVFRAGMDAGRADRLHGSMQGEAILALEELVTALDNTNWSSWQTTTKFYPALERARNYCKGVE